MENDYFGEGGCLRLVKMVRNAIRSGLIVTMKLTLPRES